MAAIGAVTAVLAVVAVLVAVKLTPAHARPVATESPASLAIVRQVSSVPACMLAGASTGQTITPLQMVKTSGPPLKVGGKPAVVFRTAEYRSTELTLRTTELADNAGRPLQAQTPLDTRLIDAFDVPPYVNSADQSGAVPFLDIANRYILAGAQYNPQVLAGLSATQIASQLSHPSSPVARAIDGSARLIIAAIDQVLNGTTAHG